MIYLGQGGVNMYDVYTKRNDKKKYIIAGVAIVGVIAIAAAFFLLKGDSKESTLKDYYAAIKEKKYDEMYNMISEQSQKAYSKDEFIKRNQNIYEGIEASDIELTIVQVKMIQFNIK